MSWKITPSWSFVDPDAAAYAAAVEAADGQALENGVKVAYDNFVLGCKADGIWSAIKASCILAGARTLNGALVPLVGTAPTNFNFVAGDYNRETGLLGNGTNKYLDSKRNNNADPQNSKHLAVYATTANTGVRQYIGAGGSTGAVGASHINTDPSFIGQRHNASGFISAPGLQTAIGLLAINRSVSNEYRYRYGGVPGTIPIASQTPFNGNIQVFASENTAHGNGRLSFYSIGESLDLALLDARVTTLMNALAVAIP